MANWCFNQMVVYGDKKEVEDFYKKLQSACSRAEKTKNWGLYEVYVEFGEENILDSNSNRYIRGNINYISNIKYDNGDFHFCVEYESAWCPMIEGFDYLLHKYYETLKQETISEEQGQDIFINTDKNGRFFKTKYHLDLVDYDIYYCETEQEVVDILNEHIDNHHFETIEDCEKYLVFNDGEVQIDGEPTYCYLHTYYPY